MRFVVTCFIEKKEPFSFIIYGSSRHQAERTFNQTLQLANPLNDFIEASDGQKIRIGSILAYRIDDINPLF
ncbi:MULTISPECIES: hypothetical protein [Exiguobacterium]|uniref:hypothetical protein n=1 Tax=Exiguobacterium TaxID=33986 RepID=UPI0008775F28|nr:MULTISPECIES: hypothetical protein [Exiguobacterium]TCI48286.1 hypothetical protein EVJ31_04420 [Exiguobacterium sp. SH5S32]TCI55173.1 hypothetical protein EVJ25_04410 [Exiguobacterium sp. SH1S4]TCI63191.1 hypothetical protein EVJ21_06675 [Exiguobacterium sp. SH0S2]TCI74966.1 hypothetical protein EVJ23_04410 [Exiguobacterium sp. SH1S1]